MEKAQSAARIQEAEAKASIREHEPLRVPDQADQLQLATALWSSL